MFHRKISLIICLLLLAAISITLSSPHAEAKSASLQEAVVQTMIKNKQAVATQAIEVEKRARVNVSECTKTDPGHLEPLSSPLRVSKEATRRAGCSLRIRPTLVGKWAWKEPNDLDS
jgi:hypothetical protein